MENIIVGICWGALIVFVIGTIVSLSKNTTHFNSNVRCVSDGSFIPKFKVEKIEIAEDGKHCPIAKYTISNCFFNKKNNKDFKYQTFYFYDKLDLYKLGDIISFTKV